MKRFLVSAILCSIASFLLSGCGTVGGAIIGGAIGGRPGAAVGGLAGAVLIDAPAMALANQGNWNYSSGQLSPEVYERVPSICYYDSLGYKVCRKKEVVYYDGYAPFYPGYPYISYYFRANQPGFIFFTHQDGRHFRHRLSR